MFSQAPGVGGIAREDKKRNREREAEGVGKPRKERESEEEVSRDACFVQLQASDAAGPISPALIDSINNTAL